MRAMGLPVAWGVSPAHGASLPVTQRQALKWEKGGNLRLRPIVIVILSSRYAKGTV